MCECSEVECHRTDARGPGPIEVLAGLWTLPVEIPIPSLQVVNVHALALTDGGVALVDAGWDDERSWMSLTASLDSIGFSMRDVRAIAVTHAHPDHLGMAHRVQLESGAQVFVSETEAERIFSMSDLPTSYRDAVTRTFPRWGVPPAELSEMVERGIRGRAESWQVDVTTVSDGDVLPIPGWSVRAVLTPGHTAGHLCFHEDRHRLLFSGDHVLPRISPNVAVHPAFEADVLSEFLTSLAKVARLEVDLVLPGHERSFTGLGSRVEELLTHHEQRLDEVLAVVAHEPGSSCWQVTEQVTWSRALDQFSPSMIRAAVAETMAHLIRLEALGRVRRTLKSQDLNSFERWFPR